MEFNKIGKEDFQKVNIQEQEHDHDQDQENENEKARLSGINIIEYYDINPKGKRKTNFCCKVIIVSLITLFILGLFFFVSLKMVEIVYEDKQKDNKINISINNYNYNNNITNPDMQEINKIQNLGKAIEDEKNIDIPKKENGNQTLEENKIINQEIKYNISNNISNNISSDIIVNNTSNKENKKIKLAFVCNNMLHLDNIDNYINLISDNLMNTGKYDIYYIRKSPAYIIGEENKDNIKAQKYLSKDNLINVENITNENIDIYLLQNFKDEKVVEYFKSLGKKVIGLLSKDFMSKMYHGNLRSYQNLFQYDLFDSFIITTPNDYYFYKKLQFKNEIYIPHSLVYESSQNQNAVLEYNNLIMVWKEGTRKSINYTSTLIKYIIKEVPDVKLSIFAPKYFIQYLNATVELRNIDENIIYKEYNSDFLSSLLNSSVYIEQSLRGLKYDLNQAKAFGLPIVAYDSPAIQPYKEGIITFSPFDTENMAKEVIKLLKDKEYRKKMGESAKKSLNNYSNKEIVEIWEKLFKSLLSENKDDYNKLQEEIENKYYNEENAKLNIQKYYNDLLRLYNNTFYCHSLDKLIDINYLKDIADCHR